MRYKAGCIYDVRLEEDERINYAVHVDMNSQSIYLGSTRIGWYETDGQRLMLHLDYDTPRDRLPEYIAIDSLFDCLQRSKNKLLRNMIEASTVIVEDEVFTDTDTNS